MIDFAEGSFHDLLDNDILGSKITYDDCDLVATLDIFCGIRKKDKIDLAFLDMATTS